MRLLQTLFFTTLVLHSALARGRRPRQNPVLGALQNILSPANAERTMQMVQFAAQRSLGNTPLPQPPIYNSPPILPYPEPPCKYPMNQPQVPYTPMNQIPNPVLPCQNQPPIPIPQIPMPQLPMPQLPNLQAQIPNLQAQIPNLQVQMPLPQNLPTQLPNTMPLLSNLLQTPMAVQPTLIPQPNPIQLSCQNPAPMLPTLQPKAPEVIIEKPCPCQREIVYPSPEPMYLTPAQDVFSCPIPSPASLFNPGLPAASPVSTWTAENMPTACSGTRSQYLRKIPIPPPTL